MEGALRQGDQESADRTVELLHRFHEEEGEVLLANCKRGGIIAIVATFGGALMDWFVYPDLFLDFFFLRSAVACFIGAAMAFLWWKPVHRAGRLIGHLIVLFPILNVLWMIVEANAHDGGTGSPYYAGLCLVMVGSVLLLRWRFVDGVINSMLAWGGYLAVAVAIETPAVDILRNSFFILVTGLIACVGLFFYNRLRFSEFCLRAAVLKQQKELEQSLSASQRYQRQINSQNQELGRALDEIKENEARLLQAEKLSSLGRMSAGIVHEINNPLNYAKTALHALRAYTEDLPESEQGDYREIVGDVEEGVGRVVSIVSDLRAFTKGESSHRHDVPLAAVVESARRLVSFDLQGIGFEVEIPEDLVIHGNDNQLCQVIVNFIQNSAEAVKGARDRGEEPVIRIAGLAGPEGSILLKIRDNGCGIGKEDIEQIFDPFFTSRDVGEGMGLGLSICHQILESHRAEVEVESVESRFTEFTIRFPAPEHNDEDDEDDDDPEGSELTSMKRSTTTTQ